eukprot:COSAG03_NODE_952_length_5213_cov_163.854713_1_plen_1027_part_00
MDNELEALCERAHADPAALRKVGDAAWANEPHRCGSGVALSPLWGSVDGATERKLVKLIVSRAAQGEGECRALAGLIRGQAVRACIIDSDDENGVQSSLVEVLERGDKHALFALFILAVLVLDEPLGDQIFSPASVVQTVQWITSIIAEDAGSDPAAARACLELMKMLTMQSDLVDAIERDEETVSRALDLICSALVSPVAVGVVHTLAMASPSIARRLATTLASSGSALRYLIETIRGGTAEPTAERMLLLALRADQAPSKLLLKALLTAEGGVAMLATLTEHVFDRRSPGNAPPGHTNRQQSLSQQPEDGTLVLTQDLQIHSQEAGDDESSDETVQSASANAGGASADLVAHYEAVLSQERTNASELMKTMASTAAAERQALQAEIDGLHKQMKEKGAKHELRVGKLTETAKRERERRVAIESSCRREKDEAATARRELAAAKDDLARILDEAEKKEASTRRDFEQRLAKATEQLSAQEADAEARAATWAIEREELWRKLVICLDGYQELEQTVEIEAKRAEADAAKMQQAYAQQLEAAGHALAECEQRCASIDCERQAVAAELKSAQAQLYQLRKVSSLMSALIDTTNESQRDIAGPKQQQQTETERQRQKQRQRETESGDSVEGTIDSPSLRSHPSSGSNYSSGAVKSGSESSSGSEPEAGRDARAGAGEQPEEEEEATFALSQTDQTPHRDAKALLRQAKRDGGAGSRDRDRDRDRDRETETQTETERDRERGGGAGSSRLKRCNATASVAGTSIRSSSASSTSSTDTVLSDAVSAIHNDVDALGLKLPTWSQALVDDSLEQGTVYYGSQEAAQASTLAAPTGHAQPALTPERSPAFEWQKDDAAANRNRRLAFLAMDPGGAGGSVMALNKPENRHSSDSEDDEDGTSDELTDDHGGSNRPEAARSTAAETCLDSLPLRRRDANAESNRDASRASRHRDKLTLLRAEVGCTQPAAGDEHDDGEAACHANRSPSLSQHYEASVQAESPCSTPLKSQRERSFGQSSSDDDGSSTSEAPSPELF